MKKENENSYQGYEVQKYRAIMTGKMGFQISVACLVAQLILLLLLIQLMVPLFHRELALYWPIARLEQLVRVNKTFPLHARDRLPKWPHDAAGIVKASGRDMIRKISYKFVFTVPEAHWDRAILLSFLAWFLWPLGLRFFAKATVKIKDSEHIRGVRQPVPHNRSMATIVQNRELPGEIRVATVFDVGSTIRPIWFEQIEFPAEGRIFVTKVNMIWSYFVGSAKNISFAVTAGNHNYTLIFDTEELTWSLSLVETVAFE
jgi:hypothetical protein